MYIYTGKHKRKTRKGARHSAKLKAKNRRRVNGMHGRKLSSKKGRAGS